MRRYRIVHVVGARPNFMKVAPIIAALDDSEFEQVLVHTGQHYDRAMSELFFEQLAMPRPDINLGIGSGSHGEQTARIMAEFEKVLLEFRPDIVVVVGDVNSTMACAIDAKKLQIPVAHVEAGLRSGDWAMPEEINRILTDSISDILFTTDAGACDNLKAQGISPERIFLVGNVMIDTLLIHRKKALEQPTLANLGLTDGRGNVPRYGTVTLHRPANVDCRKTLQGIVNSLCEIAHELPLVFPVHPRTREKLNEFGFLETLKQSGSRLVEPMGYLDFLNLNANAQLVLTDSGGIQEESTILGVPCLTLRENTERPVTITQGTNRLVGVEPDRIMEAFHAVRNQARSVVPTIPPLWDGEAAWRIARVLSEWAKTWRRL